MRILISGGGGQLAHALRETADSRHEVSALPRDQLDITDKKGIRSALEKIGPEIIINTAAYTAVDAAETHRDQAFSINSEGAATLALEAKAHGARLIHISTDYVFDGSKSSPYTPRDLPNPINTYGRSKYQGERAVDTILGNDAVIFRTAWLYSALGDNFMTRILRLLREGRGLRVVSDQEGSPTWTKSLARAIWRCADKPGVYGIQHWSDAGVASRFTFAQAIRDQALALGLLTHAAPIEPVTSHERASEALRPRYSVLDTSETQELLYMRAESWQLNLRKALVEISGA